MHKILSMTLACLIGGYCFSDVLILKREAATPATLDHEHEILVPSQEKEIEMISERVVIRPPSTRLEIAISMGENLESATEMFSASNDFHLWSDEDSELLQNDAEILGDEWSLKNDPYQTGSIDRPFIAECEFLLVSHSDRPLKRTVGFPFKGGIGSYPGEFLVEINGNPVMTKKSYTKDSFKDYAGYYYWYVDWAPRATNTIRCTYGCTTSRECTSLTGTSSLEYIVKTGNYWKGPIGKAIIIFDIGVDLHKWKDFNPHYQNQRIKFVTFPFRTRNTQKSRKTEP